ncbi:MAG: hypothetical protein H0X41_00230 [Chitinophagaceae bacterium]|nr:hypothetical protein [Chitinophagaceae bacterium]
MDIRKISTVSMSINLREAILKEHSKKQCDLIVSYVGNDAEKFRELMDLFLKAEYRVAQRASWPVSYCVRNHPQLIAPYLGQLVNNLNKKGLHDAIIRNTLRLLQDIEMPKRYHGKLMSMCFDYVQSTESAVAIKAFALTILHNLSKAYPEILPELRLIAEEKMDTETAAFKQRAKKII